MVEGDGDWDEFVALAVDHDVDDDGDDYYYYYSCHLTSDDLGMHRRQRRTMLTMLKSTTMTIGLLLLL